MSFLTVVVFAEMSTIGNKNVVMDIITQKNIIKLLRNTTLWNFQVNGQK